MKPRSIGIVAGGGGPIGSASVLQELISECQRKYGSCRSYEYPCINFYSFPYSEIMLTQNSSSSIASRELSHSIQQLKLVGMEIIVVPCFTMCSYLTYRKFGVELIEMGPLMQDYLKKNNITNPLVLCSERTRKSRYCENHFACTYPNDPIQREITLLIERALSGKKITVRPLLDELPDVPILCAATILNAQMLKEPDDPRWINPNKLLAQYVICRSFEDYIDQDFEYKEESINDHEIDPVNGAIWALRKLKRRGTFDKNLSIRKMLEEGRK